jgi:zinc transport system substrate-binding protein
LGPGVPKMAASNTHAAGGRGSLVLIVGMIALLTGSLLISSRRPERDSGDYKILCSFLPVYVFAQNVVGHTPGVEVELLLSPDLGCPHDYSVRPDDLVRVNRADLIVANGLGIEPFLDALVAKAGKPRGKLLTISDDAEVLEAGPEDADADEHEAQEGHAEHHHHGSYNPHVWASPVQAAREVRTLASKLAAADPAHAERYRANGERYARRLESLAERMRAAARGFKGRNIVTFHDAFAYLARDLDLNVVTTLTVDPQSGTSANQMRELADTIRKNDVAAIFYEPAYSDRVAKKLAEETGVPAYALNPFNYVNGRPDAASYERVMEENLKTLEQALGAQR